MATSRARPCAPSTPPRWRRCSVPDAHVQDDLNALAEAIEAAFPDRGDPRPLRFVGSGFRSLAVETAGGDLIRVGRSPDATMDYEKEWRTGPFLASRLGPLVPRPLHHAPPSERLPHGAILYRKRPGEMPTWGTDPGPAFARDLGAFMARLHRLDLDEARSAGLPQVDAYGRMLGARDVVMPELTQRLDAAAFARIKAWWDAFRADIRMRTARLAVCHHDLWHDNLLISEDARLAGALDLAHVEVTDPAHDFAAPRYFGEAFMRHLLDAYRKAGGVLNEEDEYRAYRYYEAREFGGLAWAIEHDDEAETEDAIRKVVQRLGLG